MSAIYANLVEAREELALLEREMELRRTSGISFYEPYDKQDRFHAAGLYHYRYFRFGNRGGKSTCGCTEAIGWLRGCREWYLRSFDVKDKTGQIVRHHDATTDSELAYRGIPIHPVKGLLVVVDWDKSVEIFTRLQPPAKIFSFITEAGGHIAYIKNSAGGKPCEIGVHRRDGAGISVLYIDTVESFRRNKMSQESSDWDFVWIDEPLPEQMYKAIARGLVDRDGSAWFMCTPLSEIWINDLFWPSGDIRTPAPDGAVSTKQVSVEGVNYSLDVWKITGSMHDNPNFKGQEKARFISLLSDHEKETRIEGRPAQLTGVVYPEFSADRHILRELPRGWTNFWTPPELYTIRVAIDTHPAKPTAILLVATSPTGRSIVYNEIYVPALLPKVCELLHTTLGGRIPYQILLEQAAWNPDPVDSYTYADVFLDNDFAVEPAPKDLAFGIMEVKSALLQTDDRLGHPLLMFSPLLSRTFFEFDRYIWDGDKGRPVDANDHMMENLYRLVIKGLHWVDPDVAAQFVRRAREEKPMKLDLTLPGEEKHDRDKWKRDRYRTAPRRVDVPLDQTEEFQEAMRMFDRPGGSRRSSNRYNSDY